MKKAYTPRFKAQVVLELLKETKTISQLAAEYEVHPNVLRAWRDQVVKELPAVFEKRDSLINAQAAHAKQLEELYAEIGRLTTHVTFLKKGCRPEPYGVAQSGRPRPGRPAAHHAGRLAQHQSAQPVLSARPATAGGGGHQTSHRRTVHCAPVLWLSEADGPARARVRTD